KTREIGPAVDVYALGATLYDLLTGLPPFIGATPVETVLRVMGEDPIPPRVLQPNVPRDLETVCLKCLEKHPRKRYPTAEALADDRRRFLDGRPVSARPIGRLGRLVRVCRRKPREAALTAAALLLAAVTAAGVVLRARSDAAARAAAERAAAAPLAE